VSNEHRYQKYAADCFAMAQGAQDPATKADLLDMAESWRKLAEQAAKNSRADLVYEPPPERIRPE
jgi:hypothetical protein